MDINNPLNHSVIHISDDVDPLPYVVSSTNKIVKELDENSNQIIKILIICVKNLGMKTSVYVLFVGILNGKSANFAEKVVEAAQNEFFLCVQKHDFHHARPLVCIVILVVLNFKIVA
jgi:hypothetical protein